MHLHAQAGHIHPNIGGIGLGNRRQEIGPLLPQRLLLRLAVVGAGNGMGAGITDGPRCRRLALHGKEHALHVRVVNNRPARWAVDRLALHPIIGVIHRLLVSCLGNRHPLDAHGKARIVHHGEHGIEAAVFLAHQPADCAALIAIVHGAGGAGMNAELMFNA